MKSEREGNGNPLQYSSLENSMDKGAWWATVCGVSVLDRTEQLTLSFSHVKTIILWMQLPLSCFSRVLLFVTPWTVAHQGPVSMGFSSQENWSGLPCYPPSTLPSSNLHLLCFLHWQADSLPLHHLGNPILWICYVK